MITADLQEKIMQTIIYPTVRGLAAAGIPYVGFLYAGLMIHHQEIKVLEYNCRLGDPETEVILMRLQSDLVTVCQQALAGKLSTMALAWDARPALDVVLALPGYPEKVVPGQSIDGLASIDPTQVKVFHAGTAKEGDKIIATGGRVLCVTAIGDSIAATQTAVYQAIMQLNHQAFHYRRDIGHRSHKNSC